MRIFTFAKRNVKEILRDPLSIIFALLLPLFLLFIFQQFDIPSEVYALKNFTPGIIIFGMAFITLFVATLVASDRETSLLSRLYASPMKSLEYILGYVLSIIPIILLQNVLFFVLAIILGLDFNINVVLTILITLPISLLFIFLGILIGSITSTKASSGLGSVVVQLVAFTSGMYFSGDMVGKFFSGICEALPFSHALDITKGFLNNNFDNLLNSFLILFAYIIVIAIVSIIAFKKNMISDKK